MTTVRSEPTNVVAGWLNRLYDWCSSCYHGFLMMRYYFPLRLIIPHKISFVAKESVSNLFELLEHDTTEINVLNDMLAKCTLSDDLLSVKSSRGYNILQEAVMKNNLPLVKLLLSYKCNVNAGVCSLPLHVACKEGHTEIVELLLAHGARVELECGMCYPKSHATQISVMDYFGRVTHQYACDNNILSPVCHAIENDRPEMVEMLLAQEEDYWMKWQEQRPLLHTAAQVGSFKCLQFLLQRHLIDLNLLVDDSTPLHYSVEHGPKFVELLVRNRADVNCMTSQNQTPLHMVFTESNSFSYMQDSVQLLLAYGASENINLMDTDGNTPLHLLLKNLFSFYSENLPRYLNMSYESAELLVTCLVQCIETLIRFGANPNIQDNDGYTALHLAITEVTQGIIGNATNLWCTFENLAKIMEVILEYPYMNPNVLDREGVTPLLILSKSLMSLELKPVLEERNWFKTCVDILCREGTDTNIAQKGHFTTLNILIFVASDFMRYSQNSPKEKRDGFAFIDEVLNILLAHGQDPNLRFSKRTQHSLLSLMDMVTSASSPSDLDFVYQLTVTLLRWGADPNIDISTTEPMICHSQSSVFLKKSSGQVMYYYVQILARNDHLLEGDQYLKLLYLYYYVMDHKQLWHALKILNTQTTLIPTHDSLTTTLSELSSKPRTLKENARVALYKAINYKLKHCINQLPLPLLLKEYLMNFQPA